MSAPQIIEYVVFDIDVDNETSTKVDISEINHNHLLNFVIKLANDTSYNQSSRKAHFCPNSYAEKALKDLAKNNSISMFEELSRQLLLTEQDYNKRIAHLNKKIKAGNLIAAKVQRSEDTFIIIAKIEFSDYLERESFLLKTGLPKEKSLLRSCLIFLEGSEMSTEILLSGSSGTIPAYWYSGFLHSEFNRDNTKNTKDSFSMIESKLSYIKDESKEDYIDLRDCLIGYYKGNTTFNFDDLVESLTEKYQPVKEDLNLSKLKEKLNSLKKADKFDGIFDIDRTQVRARARRKYSLDNDVDIVASYGTASIGQTSKGNKKFVLIESKNIPDDFKVIDFFNGK